MTETQDDRRWVKTDNNGNIVGVELYDSYVNVKNTQWIVDKLRRSTSDQFYLKLKRSYINFDVLQSMVHHYQETANSKQHFILRFDECKFENTPHRRIHIMQNVGDLSIDCDNLLCVWSMIKENLTSLQHIQITNIDRDQREEFTTDDMDKMAGRGVLNYMLRCCTNLKEIRLDIVSQTKMENWRVDEIIEKHNQLETFIVNDRDELHEHNRSFIQSMQGVICLAQETNHAHSNSIQDILLAFIIPLLPYVPRWFSSQEYVNQLRLCNEMFLDLSE